jgi:hypothetical protein
MENENKVFAKKRHNQWWAVIDCGQTHKGGMSTGTFWLTHFEHGNNTYRYHDRIFNPPDDLQEWQEIKIISKEVTILDKDGDIFKGWEDQDDLCYQTLSNFSELIGKPMTIEEVKNLILTFNYK